MLSKFKTYQLAKRYFKIHQNMKLKNPMKDQFERAMLSVVLNIAEGSGKIHKKEKRRFYSIALGSLRETQALLELVDNESKDVLADELGAHLFCLIKNPGGI